MKFRIDQDSYIDDKPVRAGQEIELAKRKIKVLDGKGNPRFVMGYPTPGPHWFPLDDDAKALMAESRIEHTGEVPDVIEQLKVDLQARLDIDYEKLAEAMAKANAAQAAANAEAIGSALAKALAPLIQGKPAG